MPPTDGELPPWLLELRCIPQADRSPTQSDLVRAMDIVTELQELYASSAPPPPPSSPAAERSLVAALESMTLSFRGNVAYALVPLPLYAAVMPEGVIKVAFERAFAQMSGLEVPQAPRDVVLFAAERLLTCVFAIKPVGKMQKGTAAPMVMGLAMLEGLLGGLAPAEGDAALVALGSRLAFADLRAVWLYARAVYMLEADAGGPAEQCTRVAVRAVFDALERGPLCWYLMSNYSQIFDRAQQAQGLGPVNGVRVRVLRRYLAAAEAEGDPYRAGWCAADLSLWLLNAGAAYAEVEGLVRRAEAARERCRAGLPAFTVNSGFRLLGEAQAALERFRAQFPDVYADMAVQIVSWGSATGEVEVTAAPPPGDVKACDACGAEGRGMSVCTGCRKVSYCNKTCQKRGWKDHKEECKRSAGGGDGNSSGGGGA